MNVIDNLGIIGWMNVIDNGSLCIFVRLFYILRSMV